MTDTSADGPLGVSNDAVSHFSQMSGHLATTGPLTIALLLESDGPGGAEVIVLEMARELQARGHRVIPIGPAIGIGWLGERLAECGLQQVSFTKRHPLDPRWIRDFRRIFLAHNVDIVHSHEFSMAVYGTAAARTLGIPAVNTLHGAQSMTEVLRRRVALRWALRNAKGNFTVSHATKRQLDADLGLNDDMIGVVWNGIPVRSGDRERTRSALGVAADELLVLAIGTLEERKGHRFLLDALTSLPSGSTPKWRLAVACGRGGPMRDGLETLARERGVADRLQLLTYRNDIPDLLAAADVFSMPSLWEGLPLALLEAMVARKPIVASRTSGIPEAIADGQTGLLTEPGDVEALTDALGRLLADAGLRERLAREAQSVALQSFTISAMVNAYEAIYAKGLAAT